MKSICILGRVLAFSLTICLLFASTVRAEEIKFNQNQATQLKLVQSDNQSVKFENILSMIRTTDLKTLNGDFTSLIIEGYTKNNEFGSALLPMKRKLIEIPAGAVPTVKILNYSVKEINLSEYGISNNLYPSQPPLSKNIDEHDFVYNLQAYSNDSYGTKNLVEVKVLGYMRSTRIARVEIAPIQYNAVQNTLRVYENIEFEVVFENADIQKTADLKARLASPFFENTYGRLANRIQTETKENFTKYPVKYVIVSDPMFEDQLQEFITWKVQKGFNVIEAYTDDAAVGNTTASIKSYLQDLYNAGTVEDPAPSFVLFVGDVQQIPTFSPSFQATDRLYVEYTGDLFPDVYYGRFSAQNADHLQAYLDKTLQYEQYTMPDPSYLNDVVLVSGVDGSFATNWGNGQINYGTINYFNTDHGINAHVYLYPASGGSISSIINDINNGVTFSNYTAHCSSAGWADPSFTISDVPGLTNINKYGLMIGNCCSSSTYTQNETFAEAITRTADKGCVGYIGGSESTYWDEDYYFGVGVGAITENPPPYEETTAGAYDGIFHDHGEDFSEWFVTMDQVIYAGNLAVSESGSTREEYYWDIYNLMGDPSLMIYFSEPPVLSTSFNPVILMGVETFEVTAEAYSYAALSKNGVLIAAAIANEAGLISFNVADIQEPGDLDLVITTQNRQPFISTVAVVPPTGPFVVTETFSINDDAANGNGLLDYNETVKLSLDMKNVGVATASNVVVSIASTDQYITISDDNANLGVIDPDEVISLTDEFEFTVAADVPDGYTAYFNVEATDGTDVWESGFNITAHSPILEMESYSIADPNGNSNGKIDPGETVEITIYVKNTGSATAANVIGDLISDNSFLNISSDPQSFGNINGEENAFAIFTAVADALTPAGEMIGLNINITADLNINAEGSFSVVVGQIPVLIIDMDGNNNSANVINDAIEANGLAAEFQTSFPADLNLYASIFVCLGIYSDNHELTTAEGDALAEFLTNGGSVYMEGGDTWYFDDVTAAHAMFNINGLTDGSSDLVTVEGQDGTPCEGMSFSYGGDNNWIDHLEAVSPAMSIFENSSPAYTTAVAYDAGTYKTIGCSHEFGGLTDGSSPNTKAELMYVYLDFMGMIGNQLLQANFTSDVVDVCENDAVSFTNMTSGGDVTSFVWEFEGGNPATSTEENPVVYFADPGTYDVKLTITTTDDQSEVTKTDYITVHNCMGIEELKNEDIKIYPNPFNNQTTISINLIKETVVEINVVNTLGQNVAAIASQKILSQGKHSFNFDASLLDKGVYMAVISTSSQKIIRKLILVK